jgi:iron-sulfur cluster repair protein YtfE (RIC family)
MPLTETLKQQHAEVLRQVDIIQAGIEKADRGLIRSELEKLGTALVAHLMLEDRQLYPEIERLATESGSEHLAVVARQFASNMGRISAALLAFLAKYEKPFTDLDAFKRDWSSVLSALEGRIMSEETTLYPLYEKAVRAAERRAQAKLA